MLMLSALLPSQAAAYFSEFDVEWASTMSTQRTTRHHLKHEIMRMAADIDRIGTGNDIILSADQLKPH
jgi:hypothetical protein